MLFVFHCNTRCRRRNTITKLSRLKRKLVRNEQKTASELYAFRQKAAFVFSQNLNKNVRQCWRQWLPVSYCLGNRKYQAQVKDVVPVFSPVLSHKPCTFSRKHARNQKMSFFEYCSILSLCTQQTLYHDCKTKRRKRKQGRYTETACFKIREFNKQNTVICETARRRQPCS